MKENIWIVITTINQPTKAVLTFAKQAKESGWQLLVVGDTKTPKDWHCDGCIFLSIEDQWRLYPQIAKLIPVKHYCRKNIGYLYALQHGATIIVDTDDDNLPYETFGQSFDKSVSGKLIGGSKWANIYAYYTDSTIIWPRGLPLKYIHIKGEVLKEVKASCTVQQFLADKDPDVDAIFRLINKEDTYFTKSSQSYIVNHGTFIPFNSQNTFFFKEVFPLLYLPCFVSFRMTDIWRSFVAQRLLKHIGSNLAFHSATVWQDRNDHDLMKDFSDEIIGYQMNEAIAEKLIQIDLGTLPLNAAVLKVWDGLYEMGIVTNTEMEIVGEWLKYFE